jgi:hypothetical protein
VPGSLIALKGGKISEYLGKSINCDTSDNAQIFLESDDLLNIKRV